MTARALTVLGATGSIGLNTLNVMARHPDKYRAVALSANTDVQKMLGLCREHRPRYAVMRDEAAAGQLRDALKGASLNIEVMSGEQGLREVATLPEVDTVMAAIVGAAGLLPTLAAAQAGKRILLANKEALVMSGALFMDSVKKHGAQLLPVDSEHNAIFQCLPPTFGDGLERIGVKRILLTASGGPFRTRELASLHEVTPDQACAHPNWEMGRKISVDSATMMNKGLELIEACWLFNATTDTVQVIVHPQSVIHSMVEYVDGSVLAQLGTPDMRTPIANALAWPERIDAGVSGLDLLRVGRLDFEPPDFARFPCLRLAYDAISAGGAATTVLNAANEVAVDAFLKRKLPFTAIASVIEHTLGRIHGTSAEVLEQILEADERARREARAFVAATMGH